MSLTFGILISVLASYATLYLLLALLAPLFHHRHVSVLAAAGRKAPKWLLIPHAAITVTAFGVLTYNAAYGIITAVPYNWGAHDEDGIWQSARDELRLFIAVVGSLSLPFVLDYASECLTFLRMERIARRTYIRALAKDQEVGINSLKAAAFRASKGLEANFKVTAVLSSEEICRLRHAVWADIETAKENSNSAFEEYYDGR